MRQQGESGLFLAAGLTLKSGYQYKSFFVREKINYSALIWRKRPVTLRPFTYGTNWPNSPFEVDFIVLDSTCIFPNASKIVNVRYLDGFASSCGA